VSELSKKQVELLYLNNNDVHWDAIVKVERARDAQEQFVSCTQAACKAHHAYTNARTVHQIADNILCKGETLFEGTSLARKVLHHFGSAWVD
jgi:hypothetical protein